MERQTKAFTGYQDFLNKYPQTIQKNNKHEYLAKKKTLNIFRYSTIYIYAIGFFIAFNGFFPDIR